MTEVDKYAAYVPHLPTERDRLELELADAIRLRDRTDAWTVAMGVGPPAIVAMGLALFWGHLELLAPFFALGFGVQIWRSFRVRREIERIRQELKDPMDGS